MNLLAFMIYDPHYFLFMIPGFLVGLWATIKVQAAYAKYSRIASRNGLTGAHVARLILDRAAADDFDGAASGGMSTRQVRVEATPGHLSDHYDPQSRVLRLSEGVYHSTSLAALGIAAHEAGHALQHAQGYGPLGLRTALYPLAAVGSQAWVWLILAGMFFGAKGFAVLLPIGIGLFSFAVLFYLVTLPVEFNASRRAMACLTEHGIVTPEESEGAWKVLSAAALTYVAAALTAVLQLFYLLSLASGRRDD